MNPIGDVIGGANKSLALLIDFNTIVDTDVGVIYLINKEFRNPNIFNLDILDNKFSNILNLLYNRTDINPLSILLKDEKDKNFIDECYKELLETRENDILDCSITTEVIRLIEQIRSNNTEISLCILYHNENQKRILLEQPKLNNIELISVNDINKIKEYKQYYFRYIEDAEIVKGVQYKTLYFSTSMSNFNDTKDDLKDSDLIIDFIKSGNQINIFNMYRKDILGKE